MFYGGSKSNHYSTSNYETSNWYKAPWKTPLDGADNVIDISSGNHFTILVTQLGFIYGCGDTIMN
jgi:alpha-tubulin suppressor-like RCC1 family protein